MPGMAVVLVGRRFLFLWLLPMAGVAIVRADGPGVAVLRMVCPSVAVL
jgi:hypothetical protein